MGNTTTHFVLSEGWTSLILCSNRRMIKKTGNKARLVLLKKRQLRIEEWVTGIFYS